LETTRRDFLGRAAIGPAILAAAGSGRAAAANSRVRTAVVGTGGRGTHLLGLALHRAQEKGDVEIVALCDVYQKRLDAARALAKSKGHDPKTFTHHQDLLAQRDIDAVIIATPDHWHAPVTLLALEGGRDVYCEKPMTHTLEEARQVSEKVKSLNRVMQVGVQGTSWTRWHRIHDLIQKGVVGKVVAAQGTYSRNDPKGDWNWPIDPDAGPDGKGENHIDWKQWLGSAPERPFDADRFFRFRKYWDYSGGIATDLNYHIVAPFHVAIENDHPYRVSGMGGLWVYHDGRETPDTFLDSADYPGKYNITIISSQVNEIGPVTLVRGTEATIHLGDEWEGPQGRDTDYARVVPDTPYKKDFQMKWGKDELILTGVGNEGDQKHMDNFFDCVHSRQQPNCHADLGYKVMTHIALSVRSFRENKMFRFDAAAENVME
jgi:predicted dehydrogenase